MNISLDVFRKIELTQDIEPTEIYDIAGIFYLEVLLDGSVQVKRTSELAYFPSLIKFSTNLEVL